MIRLDLRRHGLKSPNNHISAEGLAAAKLAGEKTDTVYDKVFNGMLPRTAETAIAFMIGNSSDATVMPAVSGLGDDDLFSAMITPEFGPLTKEGKSNLEAVLAIHEDAKIKEWGNAALAAVKEMFDAMDDENDGVGFFHSPTLELAALALNNFEPLPEEYTRLVELEGLAFQMDDRSNISIVGKISI
jgi:hypothetical protein